MEIVTLVDNITYKKYLKGEHGFCLFIDNDKLKILFDTGQSSIFINNAIHLGINISEIDYVIISHGHFDHTGGLQNFLNINKKAKIFIKKEAFFKKYKINKYIGIPFNIEMFKDRIIFLDNNYFFNNMAIITNIHLYYNKETHFQDFYIINENFNNMINDDFSDELFLVIKKEDKLNLITGCSHRGITNIIENAKNIFQLPINYVIGGFHISSEKKENILKIVTYFKKSKINKIFTSHCTGIETYAILKNTFREKIFYNYVGNEILI